MADAGSRDFFEMMREGRREYAVNVCFRCKSCTAPDVSEWGYRGDWMPICPSYESFGFMTYTGGGKAQIARALLTGTIEFGPDVADAIYKCTGCGACVERCTDEFFNKEDFNSVMLTEMLREECVRRGLGPGERQAANLEKLREKHNPYGKEHAERLAWLKGKKVGEKAETLFYVGCTASYVEQELAISTAEILEAIGEDFAVVGDEWCCGSYALRLGDREQALELAKHNAEVFRASGAKRVVTQCPGCFRTLLKDYKEMGVDLGVEVLHVTQYLAELIESGKVKFKQIGKGKKITYHDPCHLGRHVGVYEEPRKIIEALGFELVEMPRNRELAWCCGAGGGVKSGYPEWALETATTRVQEAKDIGVDTLVTTCPFCDMNLRDATENIGSPVNVLDLNPLVIEGLKK